MKVEKWFSTPIWFDYFNFDTAAVAKACLKLRDDHYENRVISNIGGWQSSDLNLEDHDELQVVSEIITTALSEFSSQIHPKFTIELKNVWVNINEKGNSNKRHIHAFSTFSGTLYIQVDEKTGNIIFYDNYTPYDHYPILMPEGSEHFPAHVTYYPKNGMLLIFPSWVPHEVQPSNSDLTRISISFNVQQLFEIDGKLTRVY